MTDQFKKNYRTKSLIKPELLEVTGNKRNMKKNTNNFIAARDLIGQNVLESIRRDQVRRLISGRFNIGITRRTLDKIIKVLNKKNIVRVICIANVCIPGTCFPVTNPIIIKVSKKISKKKFFQQINIIKMRFM